MKPLVHIYTLVLLLFRTVAALLSQDTLYDYDNRTLYIHLHNHDAKDTSYYGSSANKLFKIPFDTTYNSGDSINSTIASPPNDRCNIVIVSSKLYSLCPSSSTTNMLVYKYNSSTDAWSGITLNSTLQYYNDSTYLFTGSDTSGIYIFSGVSPSNSSSLSNRMIRLDTNSWATSYAASQVQPSPFYKSSTLQINSNTQALFGGITSNDRMVSMMEIPVWQYNSWAERPANISTSIDIEKRTGSLMLPVFSQSNDFTSNQTVTNFEVSSVFMMGGINSNNTDAYPKFASLNVSTNIWEWEDLTESIALANNNNTEDLLLDSIIAAGMIYDTLITIKNTSTSSLSKRSTDSDYTIQLYNSTSMKSVSSIDYTYIGTSSNVIVVAHSSKNLTIALSVIIPILVIIILACLLTWLYKRYKKKKEDERNEKEIKEIVDFYEHQHKQLSELTFSSYESDYKSNGSDYDFENTNYPDSDNQSLNSWRKKRKEFEQQNFVYNTMRSRIDSLSNNNGGGSIRRSLSVASNFIQSLKRSNSTQSSIATFVTARSTFNKEEPKDDHEDDFNDSNSSYYAKTTNENPFQNDLYTIHSDSDILTNSIERPPPAVPKHTTLLTFPNRTSSTLNHIPENGSVSTFHSQSLGFIPMRQAYHSPYAPQQNYMKQLTHTMSIDSSSLTNSSSVYTKSSRRPFSMTSGSLSSNNNLHSNTISHTSTQFTEDINRSSHDYGDTGSISEDEMKNMEVQVLVGSKRRSKLRVVNPDEILEEKDEEESENPFADHSVIEEKPRCSSSSSEQSTDTNVRKRIASDEQYDHVHDESFI